MIGQKEGTAQIGRHHRKAGAGQGLVFAKLDHENPKSGGDGQSSGQGSGDEQAAIQAHGESELQERQASSSYACLKAGETGQAEAAASALERPC
jgi:hypothetical protein